MKSKRAFFFRLGTCLVLILIAAAMFYVGRGHTVYFDNKTFEHEGVTYPSVYRAAVIDHGKEVAKMMKRERGMATWIGQDFSMELAVTTEKDGEVVSYPLRIKLPYHLDGIVVNLPAMLAGLSPDIYLSEFVPAQPDTQPEDEEIITEDYIPTDL